MDLVYLNGDYMPLHEARIPVMDRGFLFGDAVYEVIPAYHGRLFRLHEHLQRLDNSLQAIGLQNPLSYDAWQEILQRLVAQQPEIDQSVYLQVTRGIYAKRDHSFPEQVEATVLAMCSPFGQPGSSINDLGIAAITLDDIRWDYCNIKTTALLANVLLRQQAVESGAVEAILIRHGNATEGAASNLFIVQDGKIITPPKSHSILPGITRDVVLELAEQSGLTYSEADISQQQLESANEIWLTSSTREIMPVTQLNDHPIGDGKPGPIWQKMYSLYQEFKIIMRGPS
ncbi:MAG: D-amino acid aminotransferase [Candidatus Polarisedimenticolaceae bacterium]|nr:D-amino acid aminotransferase [Candidatus Polarisedimenticolaceae bacterium]